MKTYELIEFGRACFVSNAEPGNLSDFEWKLIQQDYAFFTYECPLWNEHWSSFGVKIYAQGRLRGWVQHLPVAS